MTLSKIKCTKSENQIVPGQSIPDKKWPCKCSRLTLSDWSTACTRKSFQCLNLNWIGYLFLHLDRLFSFSSTISIVVLRAIPCLQRKTNYLRLPHIYTYNGLSTTYRASIVRVQSGRWYIREVTIYSIAQVVYRFSICFCFRSKALNNIVGIRRSHFNARSSYVFKKRTTKQSIKQEDLRSRRPIEKKVMFEKYKIDRKTE
ncbi:uncharacterized protein EV154DRAFT_486299 [Mucor mucedo]|uniref:uncharacterized protein n=1 Tax=Mucor mucedo TaxID=29922 RepID=UPI00221FC11A|nr:uncharacterized protein EV154DRAFT_486299 [Mucor mucedo]KAI7877673.1 hypothetical protein EV154DRAFT_486299 [Mucor mucedo]